VTEGAGSFVTAAGVSEGAPFRPHPPISSSASKKVQSLNILFTRYLNFARFKIIPHWLTL
jgi:hypothetical protein